MYPMKCKIFRQNIYIFFYLVRKLPEYRVRMTEYLFYLIYFLLSDLRLLWENNVGFTRKILFIKSYSDYGHAAT